MCVHAHARVGPGLAGANVAPETDISGQSSPVLYHILYQPKPWMYRDVRVAVLLPAIGSARALTREFHDSLAGSTVCTTPRYCEDDLPTPPLTWEAGQDPEQRCLVLVVGPTRTTGGDPRGNHPEGLDRLARGWKGSPQQEARVTEYASDSVSLVAQSGRWTD